ncbi:PREDICTED: E3 ubiquitin-protein ligase RNF6 [Chrysochloris asiatica]|uniref:RING-type E3 ubiquitin transferase n=1 Tax=Chrysochloris asiatica TaxID=185453 RepID=A0A9B0SZR7_CHRAS|nr:PREDICTED: E3 ubiquitin-protein ligase RNF6 [Chrysochloris asiatica]
MDPAGSRSDAADEGTAFPDRRPRDNERRWQQERLRREEAYYQFMNELGDEDYRLMRDHNLLGTPGEITSEELQQRLDGVREQLASQPDLRNQGHETVSQDSEVHQESSNEDSLFEWLNTFRRNRNATRSGQNGNQTWRAVSRTNPNSGEFRFSLEIHVNQENRGLETASEADPGPPLQDINRDLASSGPPRSGSPVASRTRSRSSPSLRGSRSSVPRTRRAAGEQNQADTSYSTLRRLRSGVRGPVGLPRTQVPLDHTYETEGSERRHGEGQRFGAAHVWENGARTNVTVRNTNQRLEPIRLRSSFSSRSRSPIQRPGGASPRSSQRESRPSQHTIRRPVRRAVTPVFSEQDGEPRDSPQTPVSNSRLMSRITVEEGEDSSRASASVQHHPTITLDLQVRRIRPGESRDRDSIANRTRSRRGLAANTITLENNSGGFRRTISRLERSGIRTYVSTITVPLRRVSQSMRVEPSSTALRSILRQIMSGFGELSSLMEAEAESEMERSGQPIAEMRWDLSDTVSSRQRDEGVSQDGAGARGENGTPQPPAARRDSQGDQPLRPANTLVDTGTLPILRLARFFLLNEDDSDVRMRGLTKEQIDNLSTRNYELNSTDSELSKVCSVCISEYRAGNKLRQLPCRHEFHIHCIDRWLSENCTCPICRQPVLGSGLANNG